MVKYNDTIMGCPLTSGYTVTKQPATRQNEVLRGRTRHELKDTEAVYLVTMSFDMSESQFASWQLFWDAINRGADWFEMDLILSGVEQEYDVHATAPFQATHLPDRSWQVSLQVEAVG